jgi:hypothetical protein
LYSLYKCNKFIKTTISKLEIKKKEYEDELLLKRPYRINKIPKVIDAIIIGSGPSGLGWGVLLSRQGKSCLVLEQHDVAGGTTHVFMDKGYEFDTGLHYIGGVGESSSSSLSLSSSSSSSSSFASSFTSLLFRYVTDDKLKWESIGNILKNIN